MSLQTAKDFINIVSNDSHLRNQVVSAGKSIGGVLDFAQKMGYGITETDLRSAYTDNIYHRITQFSEDDFEQVAGSPNFHLQCTSGSHQCTGKHCGGG